MGRCLIEVAGKYLEWSTVVDAPVTYGMTEDELRDYYAREYGGEAVRRLPETLERVRARGTSSYVSRSREETIARNRAGENGEEISLSEIARRYCGESPGDRRDDRREEERPPEEKPVRHDAPDDSAVPPDDWEAVRSDPGP